MTPGDDDSDDELLRDYRRASEAEGSRPGPTIRALILAEARSAALRRTPAANDARFTWWRAVAGVSVVGVALLVWRQVDRPLAPAMQERKTEAAKRSSSEDSIRQNSAANEQALQSRAFAPAPLATRPVQLLELYFPSEYLSASPSRRLWLVQDAAGNVLRSGSLAGEDAFDTLTAQVAADFPGRSLGPWDVTTVTNRQGIDVQIGVARLQ